MASQVPSPELLLERVRCVSALARAIAQDAAASDDIAQDVLLRSLDRQEGGDEALPGWLARKVKSLTHRARRAAARRARREQAAARPESLPSTSELVERAWLQRTLVEAVVALDEPYRSVVLLRYFEDLPPRGIARLRAQPVRTIQTQLARGLSQLRARLDRQLGPRTWATLIVPLGAIGRPPVQARAPTHTNPIVLAAGGALVKTQIKLIALLGASVAAIAVVFVLRPQPNSAFPNGEQPAIAPDLASVPPESSQTATSLSSVVLDRRSEPDTLSPKDATQAAPAAEEIDRERDLFGEVVDTSGRPVVDAKVIVERQGESLIESVRSDPERVLAASTSDTEGRFRLRLEPGPSYRLLVEHPTYATSILPDRLAGERVRVVMGTAARFRGQVLRAADRSAISGARVSLRMRPDTLVLHLEEVAVETDESGRFECKGLQPGTYEVDVRCSQDPDFNGPCLRVEEGELVERDLVVPEGLTIVGHVFDAATGQALADAEVSSSWWFDGSVRTDGEGRFVLRSVDPQWQESVVSARRAGYATASSLLRKGDSLPEDLRIELAPELAASGRVVDAEGHAVAAARVSAHGRFEIAGSQSLYTDDASAQTGSDGRFRLVGLSPRVRHTLEVRSAGEGALLVDFPEQEAAGGEVDLGDLSLFAPASVKGSVLGADGQPVTSAFLRLQGGGAGRDRFRLRADPSPFEVEVSLRVDDLGRFSATDLAPGTWIISANCPGLNALATTTVTLTEGELREDLELVLDVGSDEHCIAGRVVGPDGRGVFGVVLQAWPMKPSQASVSGAGMNVLPDGSFRLGGLEPGPYWVELLLWPSAPADLCPIQLDGIPTGTLDLVIELPRRDLIRGQVLTSSGDPCVGALVQIDFGDERYGGFLAVPTDAAGQFELPVPVGQHVDLMAHEIASEGLRAGRVRNVQAGAEGVVLRLVP